MSTMPKRSPRPQLSLISVGRGTEPGAVTPRQLV